MILEEEKTYSEYISEEQALQNVFSQPQKKADMVLWCSWISSSHFLLQNTLTNSHRFALESCTEAQGSTATTGDNFLHSTLLYLQMQSSEFQGKAKILL